MLSQLSGRVRWQDSQQNGNPPLPNDGTPYIIQGSRILECQHGPERHKKGKEDRKMAIANEVIIINYRNI